MTPTPSDRRRALEAIDHCLDVARSKNIPDHENAIWSSGTSERPRITLDILETCKSSLKPDAAGEWLPLDQPIGDRRAHDGGPIDILLNANDRARIPDVYFCFYSKQYLTGGTDVPVILEGDPFNKITHWTLPPRLPPPPKKDAADE